MTAHDVAPILVVDDEPEARELVRGALEDAGYVVSEASNGRDALTLLTTGDTPAPSLIVLDLSMPLMTGWEFLAILKSYHRLSQIPVLVVSGHLHQEALAHRAIAHRLSKPVSIDELLAEVESILVGSRVA